MLHFVRNDGNCSWKASTSELYGLSNIAQGLEACLYMGNMSALRDWGHAKDYVRMQWMLLQQDKPQEFVIATGFPVKPVNTKGRYFKRVASSNHQLSTGEIADLYAQSLQLSWDAYEARGHTIDQLSAAKIQRFLHLAPQRAHRALQNRRHDH